MSDAAAGPAGDAFASGRAASARREARRRALMPGAPRDRFVQLAKTGFPAATLLLFASILFVPLNDVRELSFLLSKDAAGEAGERLRITRAEYRGKTAGGEPFAITAASAVQKSSSVPVVMLTDLAARIERADGPSRFTAPRGQFFLEKDLLALSGPIIAEGAGGYRIDGERLEVDIARNLVSSDAPVTGQLPMGSFSADTLEADIDGRRVVLQGSVKMRLHPKRMP
ncbi:MAG: LPS export ABC transporter periplasmic protein LptC [Sphingomonadaceae bacterium]